MTHKTPPVILIKDMTRRYGKTLGFGRAFNHNYGYDFGLTPDYSVNLNYGSTRSRLWTSLEKRYFK